MFRTRFAKEIVAEFLPPSRRTKKDRVVIMYDGMPSVPKKQSLAHFLAGKGFWVIYPRYRGSWESEGEFLKISPAQDVSDIIDELPRGITNIAFGEHFALNPHEIFVIGGSFGGATALMASLDPRVKKVVANCPVTDWAILADEEKKETSNKNFAAYIREAFGTAYRLPDKNWKKLYTGTFFNPAHHIKEMDESKAIMFHAKDDPYVPWKTVNAFAKKTGIRLYSFARGGHLDTSKLVQRQWPKIKKFFAS